MTEPEFIRAVVERADCLLHLDVNNIHVNSCNFGFDPLVYLAQLPLERTCYVHVAGHHVEADGLGLDDRRLLGTGGRVHLGGAGNV